MDDIVRSSVKASDPSPDVDVPEGRRRSPPRAVQCLLPVWGHRFVRQFLEIGLPTLLAPGNVPALAASLPTRFVILTRLEDEDFIRRHLAFRRLSEVCETEVRLVDHLVTGSNYSTTITLAYTEAVRAAGADMLDTCFIFLVSDYVMADGSLRSVLARMAAGTSGVQVGNFQVIHEEALLWLQEQISSSPAALAIPPRRLLEWAFNHLHPATVANTVNIPLSHNSHTNRLFWQVDGSTLLGRFYLMHMIGVRPETTDFVIGSSCDYSFIPEMCPSGAVEIITDSDDYLVVEMQPRDHELGLLRPGPLRPGPLARSLSGWTTARHRENATASLIYHAGDKPPAVAATVAEADRFIAGVGARMKPQPKPHRDHPYWLGAVAAHRESTGMRLARDEWRRALGLSAIDVDDGGASHWLLGCLRIALFAQPPRVRLGHRNWPDHRFILRWLGRFMSDPRQRILLVADFPTVFTATLSDSGERAVRIKPSLFLADAAEIWQPLARTFDSCLVELSEDDVDRVGDLVDRLAPLLKDRGEILVVIYNWRPKDPAAFGRNIERHAQRLVRRSAALTGTHFVTATRTRWALQQSMVRMARLAYARPAVGIPLFALGGGFLGIAGTLANAATLGRSRPQLRGRQIATSVAFVFRVDGAAARAAHTFSAPRIARERHRRRQGLPFLPARPLGWSWTPGQPPAMTERPGQPLVAVPPQPDAGGGQELSPDPPRWDPATREPQYADCVDVARQFGFTSLGLITNQVWHDDPRRLTFVLARYKFVAKMLSGKSAVAEVGCGDAFGARIVLQEADSVDLYDFDPVFIDDVRRRQSPRWRFGAAVHDIVLAPLPRLYDGIYSLDVIEHVERSDEDAYLENLRDSLATDGVLVVGSPSLESQAHASPQSKAGHVNCKSGADFKQLMERHFRNVFLFSMNDEVVHTGFYPMAHYLIAVCCGKKDKLL
jgi:hypothetical protein